MYIDPAAGSLILQVVIAGLLGAVTTIKSARDSVKRFFLSFRRRRKEQ
jgi:hypothetical protein